MTFIKNILSIYHELLTSGQFFSLSFVLIAIIAVIVWLGTAAMVAELAEIKGASPSLVFFLNIAIPVVGPVLTFVYFSRKSGNVFRKNRDAVVVSGDALSVESVEDNISSESVQTDEVVIDNDYFTRKIDKYGQDHPYTIEAGERVYKVAKIIECLPTTLVCQVLDEAGEVHRMRVPYSKMSNVHY